jgi:hypothetical protein
MGTRGEFKVAVTKEDLVFASVHFITLSGHRREALHGHNLHRDGSAGGWRRRLRPDPSRVSRGVSHRCPEDPGDETLAQGAGHD